ncbi:MAG: hypothetical protein OHK0046_00170 [Anaerolineae bacterium]
MSDLFTPPRLFRTVHFHRHTDRTIGWLELFYDLVYVATLIQIGNFLSDNTTLQGFAQFLVLTAVVWWAWTGETFYQNRYVVDDLIHRLLVFAQIFAIATLGISVSQAFGDLYVQFTLAYIVIRFILVVMYLRAARAHPESRAYTQGYAVGFSLGIVIWFGSLLLPSDIHWVGWLLGIAVELSVPLIPWMRRQVRQWGTDIHHISERFGIFTIILLGESFVKILDDAQGTSLGMTQFLFSISGLLVVYSLWWLYFSETAGKLIDFASRFKPVAWVYGHLPLSVGLIAFGVGAKKLYSATFDYPDAPLNPDYRLLYTAAVVLYLVALALIDFGLNDDLTEENQTEQAVLHLVCAGIVLALGLTLTGATPALFVTVIAVVMVGQVVYTIYRTEGSGVVEHAQAETEPT